jgi:hypothetical protein
MPVCLSCLGQRKIQGMGFMGEVDCRTCKGTGLAEAKDFAPATKLELRSEVIKMDQAKVGSVQSIEIIGLDETWSHDALTMKGGGIGKIETLELEIEEEIKPEEIRINAVEPLDSTVETKIQRFKRKHTKPSK